MTEMTKFCLTMHVALANRALGSGWDVHAEPGDGPSFIARKNAYTLQVTLGSDGSITSAEFQGKELPDGIKADLVMALFDE